MIDLDIMRALGAEIIGNFTKINITNVAHSDQQVCPGSLFVALKGSKTDGVEFVNNAINRGAVAVITSKKINNDIPYILYPNVMNLVCLYAEAIRKKFTKPVIAVLGSAGKTTLRYILSCILPGKILHTRKSFNVKISIALELLLLDDTYDFVVLELGTDSPGNIDDVGRMVKPDYAIMSSIGLEHSEFLGDIESVRKEQYTIMDYVKKGCIIDQYDNHHANIDQVIVNNCQKTNHNTYQIQIQDKVFEFTTYMEGDGQLNSISKALYMCYILKCDMHLIISKLSQLTTISHRGNIIKIKNKTLYDFSYNANPVSMENTIQSITQDCDFVWGEMLELGEFTVTQHMKIGLLLDKNPLIKKIYTVGDINIEHFSNKFKVLETDDINNLGEVIYFQGSNVCNLIEYISMILDH